MKTKTRPTSAFILAGAVALAGAGGWFLKPLASGQLKTGSAAADALSYKYVSLDKVIAMLRGRDGEPLTHYVAVDLVFKTTVEQERLTKEHLPLLRSVAVKALSTYTLEKAGSMTIDQLTADMNRAYKDGYAQGNREQPFSEVLIGKFIVE